MRTRLIHYPVLYINMKKDIKRKFYLESDLKNLGMKYTRIEAVEGKRLYDDKYQNEISSMLNVSPEVMNPQFWLSRKNFKTMCSNPDITLARVGCYLSHLKSIKYAIDNDYEAVYIMEDDCKPLSNFYDRFTLPQNSDILYTGGYFARGDKFNPSLPDPVIKIDNENFKLWGCYSYILPSKQAIKDVYNVISSVFLQGPGKDIHRDWRTGKIRLRATNIDTMYINFFQRFGKCHVLNPVKTMPRVFDTNIVDNRKRYGLSTFLNSKDREMLEEL